MIIASQITTAEEQTNVYSVPDDKKAEVSIFIANISEESADFINVLIGKDPNLALIVNREYMSVGSNLQLYSISLDAGDTIQILSLYGNTSCTIIGKEE